MKKLLAALFFTAFLCSCASTAQVPEKRTNANPLNASPAGVKPDASQMSCYDIGYKWGVCAAKNTADRSCKPDTDAVIPERCIDEPITQQGIKDGIRSIQMKVFDQQ